MKRLIAMALATTATAAFPLAGTASAGGCNSTAGKTSCTSGGGSGGPGGGGGYGSHITQDSDGSGSASGGGGGRFGGTSSGGGYSVAWDSTGTVTKSSGKTS